MTSPRLLSWAQPVPEADDTWMQSGALAMDNKLDELVQGERVSIGAWAGRREDRALMIAVAGERSVSLAPVRIAPDAQNRTILQGTVQVPADNVAASINIGAYGVGRCWTDPGVHLPNFAVHCTMAEDSSAWVQLVAERRENLLSETVLRVLVQRNEQGEMDVALACGPCACSTHKAPRIHNSAKLRGAWPCCTTAKGSGRSRDAARTWFLIPLHDAERVPLALRPSLINVGHGPFF